MNETLKQEINQLRVELHQTEEDFKRQEHLLKRREELEIEIEKLDQSHIFKSEEKLALLKDIKRKRQEIDNRLDIIDENIEEKLNRLRTVIKEKILALYPEKEESYRNLFIQLEKLKREKLLYQEVSLQIETLINILSKALEARQKIKRLGLLSYLFGENPTDVISTHLKHAEVQAKLLLHLMNEQNFNHSTLVQFLHSFEEESKKRWGFNRIDTIFTEAEMRLQEFLKENEIKIKEMKETCKKQEKALESLLE